MLPALVAAGASLAGGLLGNSANKKARAREYAQQKEFAQSGIQWKVEDAKKAGIHPLYAMGANTVSYAPQSVGGQDFSFLSDAGQNIGRAMDATRSNPAKANALALTASQVQLEGLQLDNEIKRAQLASAVALTRQSANPGLPSVLTSADVVGMPGQGDSPQVDADRFTDPQLSTSLREAGIRQPVNPNWSDAQTFQDRYGEIMENVYGIANLFADKHYQRKKHFDKNLRPYFVLENGRYNLRRQ